MTGVVFIRMHNAFNIVSSTSTSSLVTEVTSILTNGSLENMDSTLASSHVTDVTNYVSSTSASSLMTKVVPMLTNCALESND